VAALPLHAARYDVPGQARRIWAIRRGTMLLSSGVPMSTPFADVVLGTWREIDWGPNWGRWLGFCFCVHMAVRLILSSLDRSRQRLIEEFETILKERDEQWMSMAEQAVRDAIDKGNALGKSTVYIEAMLKGHRMVVTKAAEGTTLEEAQAKMDKIYDDLHAVRSRTQ
jgi:hypothetical protein